MDQKTVALAEHNEIESLFAGIVPSLARRRDERYAESISGLENERQSLVEESAQLAQDRRALEALLPAKGRIAQREADELIVAGKHEQARIKLEEVAEAINAPAKSRARQAAIADRLAEIDRQKQAIARAVFEIWYADAKAIVQALERGFFLGVLEALKADSSKFQERTGTPTNMLLESNRMANLTADVRTEEWRAATEWYPVRTR